MYPYFRLAKEIFKFRSAPPLGLFDTHVSHHRCWPWDLDPWIELNNGRTLTLYDLGRIPLSQRVGLVRVLRQNGWGSTIAGASVRYRRRVRCFDRIEMRSRAVGWDDKFIYLQQSMWVGDEATSHILLRSAVTSREGIVPPERVLEQLPQPQTPPILPDWITAWIAAEAERPWPPAR